MQTATVLVEKSDYRPSEDEPFMNDRQLEYFKNKLLAWKEEILRESRETVSHLQKETENHADLADRASSETDRALELRTRDRQRKLISKIDDALRRIEDGTYGYCEETGEPISLKRLDARPIATLSIEAQERQATVLVFEQGSHVTLRQFRHVDGLQRHLGRDERRRARTHRLFGRRDDQDAR